MRTDPDISHGESEAHRRRPTIGTVANAPLWIAIVILGIGTIVVGCRDTRGSENGGTITILPTAATAARLQRHTITSTADDRAQPEHRMISVDGQLRAIASAANTGGNRREMWTFAGDHRNVDVTARIDEPSSLGGRFKPQPGVAVRAHVNADGSGSALIVDGNIWDQTFNRMIIGVWSWPGDEPTGVTIDRLGAPLVLSERIARITGVLRHSGNPATDVFWVDPAYDPASPDALKVGDHVDITTATDPSFTRANAVVTDVDPRGTMISVAHPDAPASTGRPATDFGTIRLHWADNITDPRSLYPRYVRIRIIDSKVWVKSWLVDEPEPGWQAIRTIPSDLPLAKTGGIGLVTNHLYGAHNSMAFGEVTITPVVTP